MPLPRFDKLASERQHQILDAALEEFAASGFQEASVNRIIQRAGISKGALYYYFSDKEDLFLTVVEIAAAGLADTSMAPHHATTPDDFWSDVARLYSVFVDHVRRDPRVLRLVQNEIERLDQVLAHPRIEPLARAAETWLTDQVRRGRTVLAVRRDLDVAILVELALAVGRANDRIMMRRGEIASEAAVRAAVARGTDLLRRLLAP